ncbi:MAG: hypothetical protein ABIN80_03370 [Dyadobacter sp.]|uniref:hypothetical protein n=1 Tax=Dyadobacter sp. TaxID=1914288 RepID=UPI0032649356
MKREKLALLCIVLMLVQLVACERSKMDNELPTPSGLRTSEDSSSSATRIATEKTIGIKQHEPTVFTVINPVSQFVKWRVQPEETIINGGTSATAYFQNAGKYRVFAIDSISYDTTFIDVEVIGEEYVAPNYEQGFVENEQLYITPISSPDSANYLAFNTVTKGNYNCLNNQLAVRRDKAGDIYKLDFQGVSVGTYCQTGATTSKATTWIDHDVPENVTNQLEITFNGKTYKGTIKKVGLKFEFIWPYDSGIIFTTKSL